VEARVTAAAVITARRRSTSIATMRSIASGAARLATARAAIIRPRRSIAMAPAATSASGAAQPPTARAATTAQPANTRSEGAGDNLRK
jgi:hypothetical protein